jgi:hypothetical protein
MKEKLKNLHLQRKKWINALCWSFYYVNDNKLVDFKCSQLMRCIIYYASSILITNAKIETIKGLILYNNENGIIVLTTHNYVDHCMIVKIF